MSVVDLNAEINKYLPLLGDGEKMSLLTVIKSFLSLHENPGKFDIVLYNKEIEDAMARIDAGNFTTLEDLEKEMQAW